MAKFTEGAWVTAVLVPALILVMRAVKSHYRSVAVEIASSTPLNMENLAQPFVVLTLDRWTRITEKALRFAMKLSDQVQAVHVNAEDNVKEIHAMWEQNVVGPVTLAGRTVPELVILDSPYRFVLMPVVEYILQVEREHPDRQIAVLVPELVVNHWWQNFLHNQRAQVLKLLLLVRGNQVL